MIVEALAAADLLLTAVAGEPGTSARLASTPPASAIMGMGYPVAAPVGYVRFCRRRPDRCDLSPESALDGAPGASRGLEAHLAAIRWIVAPVDRIQGAPGEGAPARSGVRLHASPETKRLLQTVNSRVNAALAPMSDEDAFGVSNYWTLPLEDEHRHAGNCKHYALEKRQALIDAGVPAAALFLALARTRANELHAVLVVATDDGDVVLDNLSSRVTPWRALNYRWLVRQTPGAPLRWVTIPDGGES